MEEEIGGMHWQDTDELEAEKRDRARHDKRMRQVEHRQNWESSRRKKANPRERKSGAKEKVNMLVTVMPEGVNSLDARSEEWEEIEMAVDSGATETVVAEDMLKSVETQEGKASKMGVQYEVADGNPIPNLGEKHFIAVANGGETRKMRAQVCDVNKALLSVKWIVQAGNKVVFDEEQSYIEDKTTGERMVLEDRGGMYMLKLWVKTTRENRF